VPATTPPNDPSKPPISPERRAKVEDARQRWISALIDKSRRNNLLYFRPLKTGTLELTGADARAMERLLKQEEVPLTKLLPRDAELRAAEVRLHEIRGRALINNEERGLETLFLTMGMATWESADGERPPMAPVLLIPVKVESRARGGKGFAFIRSGDIQANLVLLHVLDSEYSIQIDAEELLKALQGDDEGEVYDPEPVYRVLRDAARELKGFAISGQLMLGNFAFQKTAMVRDLRECADQLVAHDLIAAISGDSGAQRTIGERRVLADPADIDRTAPDDEFLFLDADSSQQLVIRHALQFQDGTIQGPPGTGKSQTIANLIAEFAARGKRVLFVAEKRAALDVVRDRLRDRGLEHLALDLHGAEISRRDVMVALQASRNLVSATPRVDAEKLHARLVNRRERLEEHVLRLHSVCPPTGRTLYDVQGVLLRVADRTSTHTRWEGETLEALKPTVLATAKDALSELEEFRELFLRISSSPWNGAGIADGSAVRRANALAAELAAAWPNWFGRMLTMCAHAGLARPIALTHMLEVFALIHELRETFNIYQPELFTYVQLAELVSQLTPATQSGLKRAWAFITNGAYRRAIAGARRMRFVRKASVTNLYGEIHTASNQFQRWMPLTVEQTPPRPVPEFLELAREWEPLERRLKDLAGILRRRDLESISLDDLSELLRRLAEDVKTPLQLPQLETLEERVAAAGVSKLTEELRQRRPPAESFVPWLEHAWYSSALEQAMERTPSLAAFQGRSHDKVVAEFRKLDQDRIRIAADRVRREHAAQAVATMNRFPTEDQTVKAECQRKRSRMSVRKLLLEAPHVTMALRPCWMASPLSVSHLLPVSGDLFDIVLFDEASQVLPHDAVPALLRAGHAVVAGDRHQLPPTTFFLSDETLDDEEDDAGATSGFESILDLMSGLFDPWTLDWHYRSKDESLIAFSNRHIYSDRLVTFPGPGRHRAIEHHLVRQPSMDGQEDSVSDEVRKTVELIIQHASERPEESLGVITLGIKHQRRIEAALDEVRRERADLDGFFMEGKHERCFVKNLERVQGDERDAIILSVGYGKDRSGKLPYRFGPLLTDGGERRMNVAVTRARNRMTVVSSFSPVDMDPRKSNAKGVEFLRLYLQYAMSGGADLGTGQGPEVPLNDFEQGVHDALAARGVKLVNQWGASRYRIDLVAQHPTKPGRHVLAIECDGATYHSAQSARDRDRLRQQHLELLGWRFHRIWSTDWFQNRSSELDRAMHAYEEAVRAADREDASEAAPPRGGETVAPRSEPERPARARKPFVPSRASIDQYTEDELCRIVMWITSDGLLPTDEQILEEMIDVLGFERRGARIVERLQATIRKWRGTQGG